MRLLKHHKTRLNNKGSVLISLIITMVVLAALGAAMVSLTSTSMFGQVGANSSARAYFLAESGFRYAESRYIGAGSETARDNELKILHDATPFILRDNAGRFDLKVYPYFYKVAANPFRTSTLSAKVWGGFPAEVALSSGKLKIGTKASSIYDYSSASQSGENIIFNVTQTLPNLFIDPNDPEDILPVAVSSNSLQVVNEGDSLLLQAGTADPFPKRNGTFQVNSHIYAYKEKDPAANRLLGITDPSGSPMSPLTVAANTNIILQKFVKLHSTGIFGQGSVEGAASRKVVYHVPLPTTDQEKKTYHETFNNPALPNWLAVERAHSVKTVGVGNVLMIDTPPQAGLDLITSLITFNWSNTGVNLTEAHRAAGDFLSYDAQVKIGFSPQPEDWEFPAGSPFPELYVAGLSFRLNSFNRGYGVSFLRGDNSFTDPPQDGIPTSLVPSGSIDDRVSSSSDDAEDFFSINLNNTNLSLTRNSLGFNQQIGMRFQNIKIPRGATITNAFIDFKADESDSEATDLTFYAQNTDDATTFSSNNLDISSRPKTLASVVWNNVPSWSAGQNHQTPDLRAIIQKVIDRSGWSSGNDLAVIVTGTGRRRAVSFDGDPANSPRLHVEFRLDNVPLVMLWQQTGDSTWTYLALKWLEGFTIPENDEATLLVRVKEAAAIAFDQGSDHGGGFPIEDGDVILGPSGSAIVNGSPIVNAGDWASGNASGTITINNISESGFFSNGNTLQVVGSAATARVTGFRERDNYIKVYVGDVSGNGTPNDDPLDDQMLGNPRGVVNWPPDRTEDTAPVDDFFRLMQWDLVNPNLNSDTAFRMGSGKEFNAVIRSNTFTTCSACTFNQPELGLHAMGNSLNFIYFDDFAVQTETGAGSPTGFVRTVQE